MMIFDSARQFVTKLKAQRTSSAPNYRVGTVVSATSTFAVVTISGVDIAGVPILNRVTLTGGDIVLIAMDGPAPTILGRY